MELSQWLLVLAALAWSGGLAAAIHAVLRDLEPDTFQVRMPLRLLRPGAVLVAHYAGRRLRVSWRAEQMSRLLQAGMKWCPNPPEWFALQCVLAVLAGCAALPVALYWRGLASLAPLPAGLVGWLLPGLWLRLRIRRRRRLIGPELMLHFELLLAALESGLELRGALQLAVAAGSEGPLAAALAASLQDASTGCEPDEILRRLGRRLQVPLASAAIAAVLKAEASGLGLRRALQATIAQRQRARYAHAERCAYEAPRRILWPLALCFAPSLVMALIVPAAARLLA